MGRYLQESKKIIKKFEEVGSFDVKSGKGWKSFASTFEEYVAIAFQEETSSSVQMYIT